MGLWGLQKTKTKGKLHKNDKPNNIMTLPPQKILHLDFLLC